MATRGGARGAPTGCLRLPYYESPVCGARRSKMSSPTGLAASPPSQRARAPHTLHALCPYVSACIQPVEHRGLDTRARHSARPTWIAKQCDSGTSEGRAATHGFRARAGLLGTSSRGRTGGCNAAAHAAGTRRLPSRGGMPAACAAGSRRPQSGSWARLLQNASRLDRQKAGDDLVHARAVSIRQGEHRRHAKAFRLFSPFPPTCAASGR